MFLTKQEKLCLSVFVCVVLCGSTLQMVFKKYPQLADSVNLIDTDLFYLKSDINRASEEELKSIPGIGPYTAGAIIEHRQAKGFFTSVESVKGLKGIHDQNFERFKHFLKVTGDYAL
ncbi:MAG: competence ComEA-like helix-hairpin-helix protein [Candidatus Omnitrophota bacterium]|jgi:competence ComEA-like helix-hairpin-helix protein